MAAISGEPSLEEDELSDDALAGIGIDVAGILGDEDAGGAFRRVRGTRDCTSPT